MKDTFRVSGATTLLLAATGCSTASDDLQPDGDELDLKAKGLPAIAHIACKTKSGLGGEKAGSFHMYVGGLDTGKASAIKFVGASAEGEPILVDGENAEGTYIASLNSNYWIGAPKGALQIIGDSDGVYKTELTLTKASGLAKGTLKLTDVDHGVVEGVTASNSSTEVACTVTSAATKLARGAVCRTGTQCESGVCNRGIASYTCR
jgi:hypothetical protein